MRSIYERSSAGDQFKAHKKAKQVSKGLISVADCFKMLFHRIRLASVHKFGRQG